MGKNITNWNLLCDKNITDCKSEKSAIDCIGNLVL